MAELSATAQSIEQAKAQRNLDIAAGHSLSARVRAWHERTNTDAPFEVVGYLEVEVEDPEAGAPDADARNDDDKLGL